MVHEGARFEAARFVGDGPATEEERKALLKAVVEGMQARPDVARARVVPLATRGAEVRVDQRNGGLGRYRVFFTDARTLVELSVVGPDPSWVDAASDRFFDGAHCPLHDDRDD